jgi:hypothetical protein
LQVSAQDAIHPAFQHAKQQLTQPFRFSQWTRLAFVGLLAGELGSGGGCNFSVPSTPHKQQGSEHFFGSAIFPQMWHQHPMMFAGLIILLIVVGFGFVVLFTYINSVMRFILFDSIITRECHVRQGWVRRQRQGYRLFVWQMLLTVISFAGFLVLFGIPLACAWALGWLKRPSEHLLPLILGGIVLFFAFVAFAIALAVVHVMTKDFVVPQVALEDIGVIEAWRRLWSWLKGEKTGYAGYIGMKILLAIGVSIVLGVITLVMMLMLLVPIGGVGVIAVLWAKAAGLTWTVYTIAFIVVLGCILLALFMFAASLISVPGIVFFPAYSIYFLAPRYAPLAAALWPQPQVLPPGLPSP